MMMMIILLLLLVSSSSCEPLRETIRCAPQAWRTAMDRARANNNIPNITNKAARAVTGLCYCKGVQISHLFHHHHHHLDQVLIESNNWATECAKWWWPVLWTSADHTRPCSDGDCDVACVCSSSNIVRLHVHLIGLLRYWSYRCWYCWCHWLGLNCSARATLEQ